MAQPAIHKIRKPTAEPAEDVQTQIQTLAYHLLERGAPIGSPEQDWLEAESRLTKVGTSEQ